MSLTESGTDDEAVARIALPVGSESDSEDTGHAPDEEMGSLDNENMTDDLEPNIRERSSHYEELGRPNDSGWFQCLRLLFEGLHSLFSYCRYPQCGRAYERGRSARSKRNDSGK
jgi:hypothetical protein